MFKFGLIALGICGASAALANELPKTHPITEKIATGQDSYAVGLSVAPFKFTPGFEGVKMVDYCHRGLLFTMLIDSVGIIKSSSQVIDSAGHGVACETLRNKVISSALDRRYDNR